MYSFLITVLMYDSVAEERILFDHEAGGGGGFLLKQEEYREGEGRRQWRRSRQVCKDYAPARAKGGTPGSRTG